MIDTADATADRPLADLVDATTRRLAQRLAAHPFLVACRDGSVRPEQLERFLVQQFKYSAHFTRLLCAMMASLPTSEDFLALAENLCDELGLGDSRSLPHSQIYRRMLDDFGLDPADWPAYPETQSLIDTMYRLCRDPDPLVGLGALCLGAESIVPSLYADLVAGFESQGVDRQRLHFFTLHIGCDDAHAETMRQLIRRYAGQDALASERLVAAGDAALAARLRFFDRLQAGSTGR